MIKYLCNVCLYYKMDKRNILLCASVVKYNKRIGICCGVELVYTMSALCIYIANK